MMPVGPAMIVPAGMDAKVSAKTAQPVEPAAARVDAPSLATATLQPRPVTAPEGMVEITPPDFDAPAGPPPAFDASLLERARETDKRPATLPRPAEPKDLIALLETESPYDMRPSEGAVYDLTV